MKKNLSFLGFVVAILLFIPTALFAQKDGGVDMSKYLAGAVPVKNGFVEFEKSYKVPGKTQGDIYTLLKDYVQSELVEGPNHLEQARIVNADSLSGTVVADIEEELYFRKGAWRTDFTRFFYQIIATAKDGEFSIIMRRIHYLYDTGERPALNEPYRADEWITDEEALKDNGTKLTRIGGKFRRFTIDRKDEIFLGAARAVGAVRKVKKVIEVEE